ncbi:PQQ-dependent sugar dehydrogenase [Exiguobacterium sp. PFWT01]|uniref:PQQ-dependent sugar dehydrogenase n=1 Tax=Exiguobacterium sp. PFWT01 TaxID=2829816 RepID=UPI001BA4B7C5|nr:PQQ-dependent sugar dehydrogenase [Exiguobacterium sp. PFWT01]QUP86628.1 PQQ-dependent sugar dehydrogenase [Exiguobacterium sp. PFWT01]
MKRQIGIVTLLFLMGCTPEPTNEGTEPPPAEESTRDESATSEESNTTEETELNIGEVTAIAENLEIPWSLARSADEWFVSERGGTIAVIDDSGRVTQSAVNLDEDVFEIGEGGLLGIALSDDFESSGILYAYHTYGLSGRDVKNRVVELTWDGERFEETGVLIDEIPGARFHNGGRLLVDGAYLWVTTGDALVPELAQDESSLAGKILRIPLSGEGEPTDWIYSLGHRNPQGLSRMDDTLYASEHGASGHDEVNVIEEGNNYGWPLIEANEEREGLVTPWFEVGETSWAPSGIATDERYVYMATLRNERLVAIDRETKQVTTIVEGVGRIRDVWLDDDTLYFISNNTDGRGNPQSQDDKLYQVTIR